MIAPRCSSREELNSVDVFLKVDPLGGDVSDLCDMMIEWFRFHFVPHVYTRHDSPVQSDIEPVPIVQ